MRAVIKCEFIPRPGKSLHPEDPDSDTNAVLDVIHAIRFTSPLADHHEEIAKRRSALLSEFYWDRALLEWTCLQMIYHAATDTWGLITEASLDTLDIRLANPVAERLKSACSAVVHEIQRIAALPSTRDLLEVRFIVVHLFEGTSDVPVYVGQVLRRSSVRQAINEQRLEAVLAVVLLSASMILFYLTSPLSLGSGLRLGPLWAEWFHENASSLFTATLAAGALSLTKVILHWFDVRRASPVRWSAGPAV